MLSLVRAWYKGRCKCAAHDADVKEMLTEIEYWRSRTRVYQAEIEILELLLANVKRGFNA